MSTVMRPRGPLPPHVYWTRRVLLVAVAMVVVALAWWLMPGFGGSGNAAADPGNGGSPPGHHPSAPAHPTGTQSTSDQSGGQRPTVTHHPTPGHGSTSGTGGPGPPTQGSPTGGHPTHGHPTKGHPTKRPPQPPPSGPCDPTKVRLAVVVANAPEGHGTTVGLRMSTGDGSTCSLGITPSLLETRITSGDVIVWQSGSCPDALAAKNVVVRPKPTVVYSYDWDGQINPDSCSATDRIAQPGGYWAEAALIGGEPHKAYFEVTAPAKA